MNIFLGGSAFSRSWKDFSMSVGANIGKSLKRNSGWSSTRIGENRNRNSGKVTRRALKSNSRETRDED
jgi:hypothetical protein